MPFNFSDAGSVSGGVFRAGYGLSADDYEGADSPRIVILSDGTPDDFNPHASGIDPSPRRKATTARKKTAGAAR